MGFIDGLQVMFGTREAEQTPKEYSASRQQETAREIHHENRQLRKRLDSLEEQLAKTEKTQKEESLMESQTEQVSAAPVQENTNREDIDQLIVGVTIQIQEMIDALDKQMEQLDQKVSLQVRRIGESSEKQLAAFRVATDQLDEMHQKTDQIADIKTSTDQIAGICADTAQLSVIRESTDQINEIRTMLLQLAEIKQAVMEYKNLKVALEGLKNDMLPASETRELLNSLRTDLTDKIHTEDVKCYRNIKSLMNELGSKMDDVELSDAAYAKLAKQHRVWKVFSVFAVVDCGLMVAYFLYTMGILNNLFHLFM